MMMASYQVGCQLNCWHRELDFRQPAWEKLDAALVQLKEAGYAGAEVPSWSVPHLGEPERLRDLFGRLGVTLISLHVGGPFHDDVTYQSQTLEKVLPVAQCAARAGAEALVVSNQSLLGKLEEFGTDAGRQTEAWRAQVRNFTDLARRLRDQGLRTYYHNHDQQFRHDAWEMESLLEADPKVVELCVDVGHASQSLAQPALNDWLGAYWNRIGCLHFKDIRGGLGGQVVEALGDGGVDFDTVLQIARDRDFGGWVVTELDPGPRGVPPLRSSLEDARLSYQVIARYAAV